MGPHRPRPSFRFWSSPGRHAASAPGSTERRADQDHPQRARVLVVTDRTAATPALLAAVRDRARRGPAEFRVLVPNPAPAEWHPLHPERRDKVEAAERVLLRALTQIQDAVDDAVRGRVSVRHDPMAAVEEMLHEEPFDEIIISVVPHGLERWLHVDLAHRLTHLGLPVTSVTERPLPRG